MKLLKTRNFTINGFKGQTLTYELNKDDFIFYDNNSIAIHKKLCDKNHYNEWYYNIYHTQDFNNEGKELIMGVLRRYDDSWGLTTDDGKDIVVVWK